MPRRRTKPFIDKKNAEHFVLMHRSQQDPKYYDDDASRYVLMSTRAQFATPLYAGPDPDDDGDDDDAELADGAGTDDDERDDAFHGASAGHATASRHARHVRDADADGAHVAGDDAGFTEPMYGRAHDGAAAGAPAGASAASASGHQQSLRGARARRRPRAHDVVVADKNSGRRRGVHELSEVDEYGFPLDGYDYAQHLREGGGGTFVSASGAIVAASRVAATHTAAAKVDLPDDILPARPEEELDRMLEAINLRPELLPKDIRQVIESVEALPSTDMAAASVEELDDEFVLQAAGVGGGAADGAVHAADDDATDEFDFDTHIARLMAEAEGKVTDTANDFDDDDEFNEGGGDGDDGSDGEAHEGTGDADTRSDDGMNYSTISSARARARAAAAAMRVGSDATTEERMLAAVLEEYDDEEIGELEDDDPRLRTSELPTLSAPATSAAPVAVDAVPVHVSREQVLDTLMQEYLAQQEQERLDSMLVTGVRPGSKTVRARPAVNDAPSPVPVAVVTSERRVEQVERADAGSEALPAAASAAAPTSAPTAVPTTAAFTIRVSGTTAASASSSLPSSSMSTPAADTPATSQRVGSAAVADSRASAAAASTREVPFGCADGDFADEGGDAALEAALRPRAKAKWDVETVVSTYTNTENHPRRLAAAPSLTTSRTGHAARPLSGAAAGTQLGVGSSLPLHVAAADAAARAPVVIRLSKKTGLPVVCTPRPPTISAVAGAPTSVNGGHDGASDDDDGEGDCHSDSDGDSDGDGSRALSTLQRVKDETPEQKRVRKAAVKEERRRRREEKKDLRRAFAGEQARQARVAAARDPLAGSVPL